MTSPDMISRSQRSILTLDKSDEPFPSQISSAAAILGIDLDEQWKKLINLERGQEPRQIVGSDPRHGHTLRWLLRKWQSAEAGRHGPRLYFKAWILLRELLIRTPLTNAARLLKEHKFVNTLKETFQWLYGNYDQAQLLCYLEDGTILNPSNVSPESGNSSSDEQTTARKRKVDGTESVPHRKSDGPTVALDTLYVTICGVIRQLEYFIIDPGHVYGYAAEHMRAALKSSPDEASIILGASMYLVNHILQAPNRSRRRNRRPSATWASRKRLEDTAYESCTSPMIEFWSFRSPGGHSPSDELNNRAFVAHSMLPSLQLLHTFQQWTDPGMEVEVLKKSIESLLIKHVALPFRGSVGSTSLDKQQKGLYTTAFADDLTSSIRNFHGPGAHIKAKADLQRGKAKANRQSIVTCLSLLFRIACNCRARNTPQLRKFESHWLETLFSQILQCASIVLDPSTSENARKDYIRLTIWMLRGAKDHKLFFSAMTIESILEQASGLFDTEWAKSHAEWGVVSLCLLIDSNVFVIPSTTAKLEQNTSYRPPNKYLAALFSHMTEESCKRLSPTDADHAFKLENVLIPLVYAFAEARDLTGFITHWKEQVKVIHKRFQAVEKPEDAPQKYLTIWEDDTLMRSVADLCKSNLTIGQMLSLIENAKQDLESAKIPSGRLVAHIITLDCIFSGCSREDTFAKLAIPAQLVFESIATMIATKPDLIQGYQWRLWRLMAVINDRWVIANEPQVPSECVYSAASRARDLLDLRNAKTVGDVELDYSDRLHAFNFLLSLTTSEYRNLDKVSLRDIIIQAIEKVLDIKELFCRRLHEDHFGVLKPLDKGPEWTGQCYGVQSVDSLYIGCIACLLRTPKALSCLDTKQLERLFEQLYWIAVNRRSSPQPLSEQNIDYNWLWKALLRSNVLQENSTIAKVLRGFQATQFLEQLGSKDPKYWNINSPQYLLAFETIQKTPSSALNKGHRIEISNQILCILLYKKILSLGKMTEYIDLLIKLIEHPNKSMTILNNASGLSQENSVEVEIRKENSIFEPALIVLADKICEEPWSVENIDCFIALKRLIQAVMGYLLSTLTSATSLQYLEVLYGWLSDALNDEVISSDVTPARSIVFTVILASFFRNRTEFPESLIRELETLDILRHRHLECLIGNSNVAGRDLLEPKPRHECATMLEHMLSYADLLCIHPDLRSISARLTGMVDQLKEVDYTSERRVPVARGFFCATDYMQSRLASLKYALGSFDSSLHPSFLGTARMIRKMQPGEKTNLLCSFDKNIHVINGQLKEDLLSTLIHEDQDAHTSRENMEVLQRVIFSVEDQQLDDLGDVLSQLFMTVCKSISRPDDAHTSLISMQCIGNLLQKNKHRIISQWHVDSLLANITIKASQLQSTITPKQAALCHLGLCRIFATVLTLHRPKIGGRYHLVLPALQSLLRCLFRPYSLLSDGDDPSSTLTPIHASAYARLLTILADPTVSSVTTSRKRTRLELNDETKKARSIAGQHLSYLIMEYCTWQLKGRLTPEIKATLEPGLFAVLNVMTKEGMRTMNAALDESGRAVWKGLYEDWRRFGR